MKVDDVVAAARETLTVRRVYGEPYERGHVTVIPAAAVAGGGGGGGGHDREGQEGEGGGFGAGAKPAGVYVVTDDDVRWRPAVDVNRLATTVAVVCVVLALTRVRLARLRARGAAG